MNLPHLPPIRFAQTALEEKGNRAKVKILFPFCPTLGMMIEAAAQSSAVFSNHPSVLGFIVSLKEIQLLKKTTQLSMMTQLVLEAQVGECMEISFEIMSEDEKEIFAMGKIILKIRE